MHKFRSLVTLVIGLLLFSQANAAGKYSYVYIQGDKQMPFYVKFEGEMLPRFGKNYYIISELDPGPMTIEILFQQNAYAPVKFSVQVPESGFRGFLLTKKGSDFSLYDIHQQFYLTDGNQIFDDHLPEVKSVSAPNLPLPVAEKATEQVKQEPKPEKKPKLESSVSVKTIKTPKAKVAATPKTTKASTGEPQFIENIELKGDYRSGSSSSTVPAGAVKKNLPAIVNSDCPSAVSNEQYDDLYEKTVNRAPSTRLKYLLDKFNDCYTSNQVRMLTRTLADDTEKFTFLKHAYPRVTDQSAFPALEKLLTDEEWKGYFREMVKR